MNVNEFLICLVFAVVLFAPTIWLWVGIYRIEQWIQRIESRLDKDQSNQKDGK